MYPYQPTTGGYHPPPIEGHFDPLARFFPPPSITPPPPSNMHMPMGLLPHPYMHPPPHMMVPPYPMHPLVSTTPPLEHYTPAPVPSTVVEPSRVQARTLVDVMDDLSSRFVINVPDEELASWERIFFQVEAAHWFYEDFYREECTYLPSFSLREFARQLFNHCQLLRPYVERLDEMFANFTQYKIRVPVFGAIILNEGLDKCLLVKGWTSKASWGFPKGKVNKDEIETDCAIREVLEETGFDISDRISEHDYIEVTVREQKVRLFIICDVPEDTPFMPRTRKEISKIAWIPINELPTVHNSQAKDIPPIPVPSHVRKPNNYYTVVPFVNRIKQWVRDRKRKTSKGAHARKGRTPHTPQQAVHFVSPPTTPTPNMYINNAQSYSPYPNSPPASPRAHDRHEEHTQHPSTHTHIAFQDPAIIGMKSMQQPLAPTPAPAPTFAYGTVHIMPHARSTTPPSSSPSSPSQSPYHPRPDTSSSITALPPPRHDVAPSLNLYDYNIPVQASDGGNSDLLHFRFDRSDIMKHFQHLNARARS
eukprot:TRINITY_DN10531_c0_g1_i1.p1 TRINITY_DN10531_c0_g1~~TRINITY_DN10531_c0_g1_i1.p1  ORF type:complete len:534 (+),score=134.40 TRINITY_DN10531_c0_g1_i1:145-1746(+)